METPNLSYIDDIARGDELIKKTLIDVIKKEFPVELEEYYKNYTNLDYKKIEADVHKIKHKISILGLKKNYEMANQYEHNLREKNLDGSEDFEKILNVISNYLKTI